MYIELKEYQLVMVRSKNQQLSNGKLVRIKPFKTIKASLYDYGYIKERCFSMGEQINTITIYYSDDSIISYPTTRLTGRPYTIELEIVEPYLISSDIILAGDLYLVDNIIVTSTMNHSKPIFINKVVATPPQIGLSFYDGMPHYRTYDYKDGVYLEVLHPNTLLDIINNNKGIMVSVEEVCPNYGGAHLEKDCSCKTGFIYKPILFNDKVILHTYGLPDKNKHNYLIVK